MIPGHPLRAKPAHIRLKVSRLRVAGIRGTERVRGVSFRISRGEIVAIAGATDNGQLELLEAIAGLRPSLGGRIYLNGTLLSWPGYGPRARRRLGLTLVPEDQRQPGMIWACTAEENSLPGYRDRGRLARESGSDRIKPPPGKAWLSGVTSSRGNIPKLVLAREFSADSEVLLVGSAAMWGLDSAAIEFIRRQLAALRAAGRAILLISIELDAILGLADRILVMRDGKISKRLLAPHNTTGQAGRLRRLWERLYPDS